MAYSKVGGILRWRILRWRYSKVAYSKVGGILRWRILRLAVF